MTQQTTPSDDSQVARACSPKLWQTLAYVDKEARPLYLTSRLETLLSDGGTDQACAATVDLLVAACHDAYDGYADERRFDVELLNLLIKLVSDSRTELFAKPLALRSLIDHLGRRHASAPDAKDSAEYLGLLLEVAGDQAGRLLAASRLERSYLQPDRLHAHFTALTKMMDEDKPMAESFSDVAVQDLRRAMAQARFNLLSDAALTRFIELDELFEEDLSDESFEEVLQQIGHTRGCQAILGAVAEAIDEQTGFSGADFDLTLTCDDGTMFINIGNFPIEVTEDDMKALEAAYVASMSELDPLPYLILKLIPDAVTTAVTELGGGAEELRRSAVRFQGRIYPMPVPRD